MTKFLNWFSLKHEPIWSESQTISGVNHKPDSGRITNQTGPQTDWTESWMIQNEQQTHSAGIISDWTTKQLGLNDNLIHLDFGLSHERIRSESQTLSNLFSYLSDKLIEKNHNYQTEPQND